MGELVTTLEDLSRKCLKLHICSSTWKWSTAFFGLLITEAQIKNRSVGAPRTGLKMGKKELVLLHLRTSLREGSQRL